MMQVAAEDTHADYVICRGFDPRILKFIDYASGDDSKPGIAVAKPFGRRRTGTYEIGEVYPAFLPTQGNADYTGFRQVVYTPPSPVGVNWRVGQNPGVTSGGLEGGQPEDLDDTIGILYASDGKVINWLLIDGGGSGGGATIEYTIVSTSTAGESSPYSGLVVASVTITRAPCDRPELAGTTVDVVDHSGCIFDLTSLQLADVHGWASEGVTVSLASGAEEGEMSPCHWCADDRCCTEEDTA